MQVALQQHGNSIYVLRKDNNEVICSLPGIMINKDIVSILKALSILLKGMSLAAKKHTGKEPK